MKKFVAHVDIDKDKNDGSWREHLLEDHLKNTALLASKFASKFDNSDWGTSLGIGHDVGKYKFAFQRKIRSKGYGNILDFNGNGDDSTHSSVGALLNFDKKQIGKILAYIIAGHHGGLPNWNSDNFSRGLVIRMSEKKHLVDALKSNPPEEIINHPLPISIPCGQKITSNDLHVWLRMLFSCLVDADFLDTEEFFNSKQSLLRNEWSNINELKIKFDQYMCNLLEKTKENPTVVNKIRKDVLDICIEKAKEPSGIFSLTVPTGGGKTLSAMGFALEHAIKYKKTRIIVGIPFTSIIEQTANTYREVFGENAVLEHHSNFNFDKPSIVSDEVRKKLELACENWDAPIVVTTNVQLFESLFSARTSSCRKLHNIVNSIIILDEVQVLPPEYLKPIINIIKTLSRLFGVTFVLCTATQPALEGIIGLNDGKSSFEGFDNVNPIIENAAELSQKLQRVNISLYNSGKMPTGWEEIAKQITQYEQVLCIVNSRQDCRDLYNLLPTNTIHLSALMCPEHRSNIISEIKRKLKNNEPIRVVSTQLVEAGVDIDFPVVYRAMAGLDSIAQAAGRCNREGKLKIGKVVVFEAPSFKTSGLLEKARSTGKEMFNEYAQLINELNPIIFNKYFKLFYSKVSNTDSKGIMDLLGGKNAALCQFQFKEVAHKFKLINDEGQCPIIVLYGNSKILIDELNKNGTSRKLLRKLQRYSVNVPEKQFNAMRGSLIEINDIWVQKVPELYHDIFGLCVF